MQISAKVQIDLKVMKRKKPLLHMYPLLMIGTVPSPVTVVSKAVEVLNTRRFGRVPSPRITP